ncbi:MAG TPA: N-acetylmuramoyl-L-alanine amidase [Terriglobales bacterium]|nr:N-acetylmuramoyl-L-alanine amidase [Terriglobales bacterium]
MSATPTRVEWEASATADPGFPLQEGNRVLESLAHQEALRALRAFSELHEQIRNRRVATGCASDRDLFETECFILDEVLQLICDRAQAITQADGVMVALAAGSKAERPQTEEPEMVCRAAAGPLAAARGVRLIGESEFLQDCLESGSTLRCDDCEIDARVEMDFARVLEARSTVLVPLRGRHQQLGVLQAFSTTVRAFSDQDIRCFDLFAELVLSALKPEDQDRRIHWLSGVATEVLQAKAAAALPVVAEAAAEIPKIEPGPTVVETGLSPSPVPATRQVSNAAPPFPEVVPGLAALVQPVVIPAAQVELPEPVVELPEPGIVNELFAIEEPTTLIELPRALPFLRRISLPGSSRPGLSVVMGLVAVAALFSAGAWWGMQVHGKTAVTKVAAANTAISPHSATTPSAPQEVLSLEFSDNLMNPEKLGSDAAPLTAVAADKLAVLPKVTGVRHWSSDMGSTVVIDMEDQVPYEVHRLMSPERIYFDLHDTVLPPEWAGKTMDVGDFSLTRVRVAQPVAGVTRVVLDTKGGSNFAVSMESNPYRLVVELRGSEKALAAKQFVPKGTTPKLTSASADRAPSPLNAAPVAALAVKPSGQPLPARAGKFRIVLDAGHGGWDQGTVGRQGLTEKDLVLDVAQRLGKLLQARLGSEVLFTRTGDTYLSLDQRADIANQAQADLFVSVHANYSNSTAARGVETYYSNLFSAPGSREAEKHEDGTFTKPTPVSLSIEQLHDKIEESRRLATSVQRSLYATLAVNSPDIRNRGIKDSTFVVLTGTTMPAILTEISFVSSPDDERNLQSPTYRQQIAEALYKGIARYQETSPRAKVAQLQTAGARR